MPKPKSLTPNEREFLRRAIDNGDTYTSMSAYLSVCVDTLKRILQREGLAEFEGAKYVVSLARTNKPNVWSRPCISCKDDSPRPKWQYFCNKCRAKMDSGACEEYPGWD